MPESWTCDRDRCRAAGVPDEIEFATKPRQAMAMLARAFTAGVPFAWVTADEAYGQVKYLRAWLEQHDAAHVLWVLARRSISDPTEIAYYVCFGPRRSTRLDLAWIAGSRWRIEECFQQAKNEAGLDHYQVRTWRAWYAHITLSMLALAWLAALKTQATKGESTQAT